jgi:hypothetical protein
MNEHKEPGAGFERELGDRLKLLVAERGARIEAEEAAIARTSTARRIAPRLAVGGAVAAVAAAAVVAVSAGGSGTPSAYAVEKLPEGGTLIKVGALEDPAGLEAILAEAGIHSQVDWLAPGMTCREPFFTAEQNTGRAIEIAHWKGDATTPGTPGAVIVAVGAQAAESGTLSADKVFAISIDPSAIAAGQTLVLYGSPVSYEGNSEDGYRSYVGIAEGEVGACEPVAGPVGGPDPAPDAPPPTAR